jgi:L-arabinokinase
MEPAVIETAGPAAFVEMLRERALFARGTTVAVSRAPGRLDVMGGIADYSGSLVLERPIAEGTWAAAQPLDRPIVEIVSVGRPPCVIPLETLAPGGAPASYADVRRLFESSPFRWAAYIGGVILVLAREHRLELTPGIRIVVASQVPEGKGVSSSAAVETASMAAVAAAFALPLDPRDLAILCQTAENFVAGAPCGVMDQMTCVFGQPRTLLALLCQPAELHAPVPVPEDVALWGLDSGERHAVGGSDYGAVRAGAFMGLRILTAHADVPGGYLANVSREQFERELARHLPEEMTGDDFLSRYQRTSDAATSVLRGRRYRVRAATAHPVYERWRVESFRELLLEPAAAEARRRQLGELMYDSHASYGRCGLGSDGTDRLVALVRAEGVAAGLYGARITGGGSGGTVAVLGRRDSAPAIARVADAYERQTGYRPHIFAGSSPGVAAFGTHSIVV